MAALGLTRSRDLIKLRSRLAPPRRVDTSDGRPSSNDAALTAVKEIVDMPDRRASLLVRLCLQNGGRLSKKKRLEFAELTDEEIEAIETAIMDLIAEHSADRITGFPLEKRN